MANTFGHLFRITTWGESHGGGVGVVVDGCPPQMALTEADVQPDLNRRRPGQSRIVTPRDEADAVEILSGTFEGRTLGTPISLVVRNKDQRSEAYTEMATKFRPSHADYTYQAKYGIRAWPGGGRTSARETIGRVAAGAIARKFLREQFGVELLAWVSQVQDIRATVDRESVTFDQVESNIVRCPDAATAERMIARIEETRSNGDSVGGVIEGIARGDVKTSRLVGRRIEEIRLPTGTRIGVIVRGEGEESEVLMPQHDTLIEDGDHIVIFIPNKRMVREVERLFQVSATFFG